MLKPLPPQNHIDNSLKVLDYNNVVDILIDVLGSDDYKENLHSFILLLSEFNLLLWEKRNTATLESVQKLKKNLINTVIKDLIFVEGILHRPSTAQVSSQPPVGLPAPVPVTAPRVSPAPVLVTVPRVSPALVTSPALDVSTSLDNYFLIDGYGNQDFEGVVANKIYKKHYIERQDLINNGLKTVTTELGRGLSATVFEGTFTDKEGEHEVSVKFLKGETPVIDKEFRIMQKAYEKMPIFVAKPYHLFFVKDYDENLRETNDAVGVLVMELGGESLKTVWQSNNNDLNLNVMENLATKLDELNSHRILHLDTNPGNFLKRKTTGQWILIDFGMSMYIDDSYNKPGNLFSSRPLNFNKFDATYMYADKAFKLFNFIKTLTDPNQKNTLNELYEAYNKIIDKNLEIIKKNEMLDIFLTPSHPQFKELPFYNKDGPLNSADIFGHLVQTKGEQILEAVENRPLTINFDVDDRNNNVYFDIKTGKITTRLALSCFRNKKFWVNGTIGKWIPKGAGQYGSVYEASYFSEHLDQPAILKVMMYPNENPESGYASANLNDIDLQKLFYKKLPNGIVKQFDSGKCKAFDKNGTINKTVKVLYVLMEKAQMTFANFEDYLFKLPNSEETQNKYKEMVEKILKIYDELNQYGYLHCDSKPENVVILQDGTPKLIDFGISKTIELYKNAFNIPNDTNISFQGFDSLYFIFQLLYGKRYKGNIAHFLNGLATNYANIINKNKMMYIFKNSVYDETSPVEIGLNLYPQLWPDFLSKDTNGSIIPKSIVFDTFLKISGILKNGKCSQYLRSVFINKHLLQKIKYSMLLLLGRDDLQNTLEGLKHRILMTIDDSELFQKTLGYGVQDAKRSKSVCGILGWTPILNINIEDISLGKYAYFLHTWGVNTAQCQQFGFVPQPLQETINIIERAVVHVHKNQVLKKSKRVNVMLRVTDLGIGNCPDYIEILLAMTNKYKWLSICLFYLTNYFYKNGMEMHYNYKNNWPIVPLDTVLVVVNEWNPVTIIGGSAKNTMDYGIVNGYDPYENIINASFLHNYFFNETMRIQDKNGNYQENPATRAPAFVAPVRRPPPQQIQQTPAKSSNKVQVEYKNPVGTVDLNNQSSSRNCLMQ